MLNYEWTNNMTQSVSDCGQERVTTNEMMAEPIGAMSASEYLNFTYFFNSFLRDFGADNRVFWVNHTVTVSLSDSLKLVIPVRRKSLVHSHHYTGEIFLRDGEELTAIGFQEMVRLLAEKLFLLPKNHQFDDLVANSLMQMHRNLMRGRALGSDFLTSEQNLLLGHPFHPYPKARWSTCSESFDDYLPESRKTFCLNWIAVDESILATLSGEQRQALYQVQNFDAPNVTLNGKDFIKIPMHPWQWHQLLKTDDIKKALAENTLVFLGDGTNQWSSLSSVRTVYCKNAPYQLKFSLDIKITNSIRHLQPKEARRGSELQTAFESDKLLKFRKQYENFDILHEPEAYCLKFNATPLASTVVQLRKNFDASTDTQQLHLLSTLVEDEWPSLQSQLFQIAQNISENQRVDYSVAINKWWQQFLNVAIEPILVLAQQHGILLGAHLQNLVLGLNDGLPVRCFYRDCQGTGFSDRGYADFKDLIPNLHKDNGNILNRHETNMVFGYYLVVNTVFKTLSALANSEAQLEVQLLSQFRNFLYQLKKQAPEATEIYDFLLNSDHLYQKGNFRCSVLNMNETTDSKPWSIYNDIANPLVESLRELQKPVDAGKSVYRFQDSEADIDIEFRMVDIDSDLDIFHRWHNQDFVSEFWELNQTKQQLKSYLSKLSKSHFQLPLIYLYKGRRVGYFEVYWAHDDRIAPYCHPGLYDRGVHLLIGEADVLRTRAVTQGIYHITRYLFEDEPRTENIWGEPRADNKKILKIADAMPGWRFLREFDFPHKRAALLQCSRANFLAEDSNDRL